MTRVWDRDVSSSVCLMGYLARLEMLRTPLPRTEPPMSCCLALLTPMSLCMTLSRFISRSTLLRNPVLPTLFRHMATPVPPNSELKPALLNVVPFRLGPR